MNITEAIIRLVDAEAGALSTLKNRADVIVNAVNMVDSCKGRIIVTGLGKSGIVARKIAATLSSIGIASIFLHPTEALHGDMGTVLPDDLGICISKSGETIEVKELLAIFKRYGMRTIGITCEADSTIAEESDIAIVVPGDEGDPIGVVPTTSVVASIVVGDAIAVGVMTKRNFTADDFHLLHPGGALGRRLQRVSELMHTGADIPIVSSNATLRDAIVEISNKKLGTTLIMDEDDRLLGILTDGDVRRAVQKGNGNPLDEPAVKFATARPRTVRPDAIAEEALHIMETNKMTSLVVFDEGGVCGLLHLHDILQRKII